MEVLELDELDKAVFEVAYGYIEKSESSRVTGATVWKELSGTGIAPVHIPARLKRLVSLGLLEKDIANSSCRYKVYAPTQAGLEMWKE